MHVCIQLGSLYANSSDRTRLSDYSQCQAICNDDSGLWTPHIRTNNYLLSCMLRSGRKHEFAVRKTAKPHSPIQRSAIFTGWTWTHLDAPFHAANLRTQFGRH